MGTLAGSRNTYFKQDRGKTAAMPQLGALLSPRGECNRAVVVSVARFYPGVSLGKRPGADRDSKNLHKTLSKLGFKVDIHSDLSSDEISELFLSGTN